MKLQPLSSELKELVPLTEDSFTIEDYLKDDRTLMQDELRRLLATPMASMSAHDKDRVHALLSKLKEQFIQHLRQNRQKNTCDSLLYHWGAYEKWCNELGHPALPSRTGLFMEFISYKSTQVKVTTLATYRWAVTAMHLATGLPDPSANIAVKEQFEGLRTTEVQERKNGVKQAQPFNMTHLELISELWLDEPAPKVRRDLLLLTLAYETMLRESELARIKVSDLDTTDIDNATVYVPYTKSSSKPVYIAIHPDLAVMIEQFIEDFELKSDDYLLCRFHHTGSRIKQAKPLTGQAVDDVFALAYKTLRDIDLDSVPRQAKWSGHSARVGGTQDLLRNDYSILQIQQAGRWKSPGMVLRYGERILAKDSAMAMHRKRKKNKQ